MLRIAMLAVHSSPLAAIGSREAGGMNVYVRELARELGRRGIAVDMFTRSQRRGEPTVVSIGPHTRVITLRTGPAAPYNKNWVLDYLPEFVSRIRCFADGQDLNYDLIHSHYWLSGVAALELRAMWRVPVVHMFHTLGVLKNRVAPTPIWGETDQRVQIETRLMQTVDAVVAATPIDRAQMVLHYNADPERIVVIPGGVDTRVFRPQDAADARRRLGLPPHPVRLVLFVGRIEPLKGLDILITSMTHLRDLDLRLLVVGGDAHAREDQWSAEERRLRGLARDLNLDGRVLFIGSRPQAQLPLLYSAADVVAVPSLYESFGLVALEAQACGTPVVASRVGGLRCTVRDGVSGFLVPPADPDALAGRIRHLVEHEGLREEMGAHAIENAQAYDWSVIAGRMQSLYNALLRRQAPAPAYDQRSTLPCSA